jgi:hypothetical protein
LNIYPGKRLRVKTIEELRETLDPEDFEVSPWYVRIKGKYPRKSKYLQMNEHMMSLCGNIIAVKKITS